MYWKITVCVAFGTMCGFRHPLGSSHISTRGWRSLGLLYKYTSYDVALLSFSGQPKYMNYEGCSFCRETVQEQPGPLGCNKFSCGRRGGEAKHALDFRSPLPSHDHMTVVSADSSWPGHSIPLGLANEDLWAKPSLSVLSPGKLTRT